MVHRPVSVGKHRPTLAPPSQPPLPLQLLQRLTCSALSLVVASLLDSFCSCCASSPSRSAGMMAAAAARMPPLASPPLLLPAAAALGTAAATWPTYLAPKAKPPAVGVAPEKLRWVGGVGDGLEQREAG